MRGRWVRDPARALRAEFGGRRLSRALAGVALRTAVLAGLCLLGTRFLIH